MKNKNYDDCSSLKFYNFENWSLEKIIEKYEVVLMSREKQITDLSIEIGRINDLVTVLSDKNQLLIEENQMLKVRLQKRDNTLSQELNNKEIMFMRLERSEQECDELKIKLDRLERNMSKREQPVIRENIPSGFINNLNFLEKKNNVIETPYANQVSSINSNTTINKSNTKETIESLSSQTEKNKPVSVNTKPSALDKIRELKERKNNPQSSNRISLTGSLIESNICISESKIENVKIIDSSLEDTSKIIQQEEKVSGNNEVTDTNSQQDEKEDDKISENIIITDESSKDTPINSEQKKRKKSKK